ncbi:MAG: class II fructose-bisphosphate aldolase [bacterium]
MSSNEILKSAQEGKYAIGSFNFSTAEILKAIVLAAKELNSPIIVSTSEGEADFIGMREAAALVGAWRAATKLAIILNLDHGKHLPLIKKAVAAGYNAIHFDGSGLEYIENIRQTKSLVDYIRNVEKTFDSQIIVEGELGYLRGSSSLHEEALEIKETDLTGAEQAKEFVEKTGVDSLAVVIGNAHGIFLKGEEKLNLERLADIKNELGGKVFLVLHGGSGIPDKDIKEAIELGIVKVNINTELRVAFKEALDKQLKEKPQETTPYKILTPPFEIMKKVVAEKIKMFGSENRAQ